MNAPELDDWQFGRLHWHDDEGFYAGEVSWTPRLKVRLAIYGHDVQHGVIPERARTIFNAIQQRENEYKSEGSLEALDVFNDRRAASGTWPECHAVDLQTLNNFTVLLAVEIDTDGDSQLQYVSSMGPLLRLHISPDLSLKETYLE